MKIATKLLRWYRRLGRDLPWRNTRNPYHILVSEVMLQQTQVDRVKLFYNRWLKQFPNWKRLAQASNKEIIHAWAGLGYNRRVLALRHIAQKISEHGVPKTYEEWLILKGIGPYTASAISAFAQKKRILPIDTNIRRVLGRILLGKPFSDPADDKKIQKYTNTFLPLRGAYYDVPQALFDLASITCTKTPNCGQCPLRQNCKSSKLFLSGTVHIPKRTIVASKEHKHRNKSYPDRIYRGRILKVVREKSEVSIQKIGYAIDKTFDPKLDQSWVQSMIQRLSKEGFTKQKKGKISL
ncbi:MAG: HhH-GPD family protein [Candidatus Uhrbacteria bacterium GW2011_GWF2_39_13]|uniref:HhH-GPD family protein n=1 Tax=Candidatus Uhrbacteria bacterium GW2011_GWF2_39_13 TaxID=1618995 RepID=A0A0G0QQA9_9BACT|nr:MAG: HhH-GPD family protein [Candidatus Uhrbacteria bacterium GW2011_GWF2_39_13]HAU65935.1 hypothetical protein [Candidatus Uhrbacteria bacterium]